MGRNTLAEFNTRFSRGLNQQPNYANLEECADCLNVYAPDGELQNRPGHEGIRYLDFLTAVTQNAAETNSNVFEDVGGVIKKYDVGTDSYTYTETDSSNSSHGLSSSYDDDIDCWWWEICISNFYQK